MSLRVKACRVRERSSSRAGAREEGREWRGGPGGDRQKQAGMYACMYCGCLILVTTACVPGEGVDGFSRKSFKRFKTSNVMPGPVRFLTFCEVPVRFTVTVL